MKLAAYEKNRLEEKQRAIRKYKEALNMEHVPYYFEEKPNVEDNQPYWRYNHQYFERDRAQKDWSRLLDIYSE